MDLIADGNTDPFALEKASQGLVCGMDEVGRAPLAGPVTAACVYIPEDLYDDPVWADVTDSKRLSRMKREALYETLSDMVVFSVASASVDEIVQHNIHHASLLAMKRAFSEMCERYALKVNLALVDGKHAPQLNCPHQTVVKGDSRSKSIAAASILAKVKRDRLMARLHDDFPDYGWESNVGYPTAQHRQAIQECGPCIHHRRSFSGVREYLEPGSKDLQRTLFKAS